MGQIIIDVLDRKANSDDFKCFVTMTDKFLCGWGCAEGKIAKRVYPCKDSRIAHELRERIWNRKNSGMTYVNIVFSFPKYSSTRYVVTYDLDAEDAFKY